MKILQVLFMVGAMGSSAVMAQDYYAPTDKQKEAVARFPFEKKPEIRFNSNGGKEITYTLPEMLTGERNVIRATAVDLPGLDDLPNSVQMFVGDKATISCMGTDANPGCTVSHRNLKVNLARSEALINDTYYDPELRRDARLVVDEFQKVAHSGNQPIGFIGALKDREDAKAPKGKMTSYFARPLGGHNTAEITWVLDEKQKLKPEAGLYVKGLGYGQLTNVKQFGNRVRGVWSVAGNVGWFDFNFNNQKTSFEGSFGEYPSRVQDLNNHKKAGVWNSGSL
jgi:hypothetical protein